MPTVWQRCQHELHLSWHPVSAAAEEEEVQDTRTCNGIAYLISICICICICICLLLLYIYVTLGIRRGRWSHRRRHGWKTKSSRNSSIECGMKWSPAQCIKKQVTDRSKNRKTNWI